MRYEIMNKYEGKRRYIDRQIRNNRLVGKGLTDRQFDALENLCQFRHEMHCSCIFFAESSGYDRIFAVLDRSDRIF